MKRFVKEYGNYRIDCIKSCKGYWEEKKINDVIMEIRRIVKVYERGLITADEALKEIMGV